MLLFTLLFAIPSLFGELLVAWDGGVGSGCATNAVGLSGTLFTDAIKDVASSAGSTDGTFGPTLSGASTGSPQYAYRVLDKSGQNRLSFEVVNHAGIPVRLETIVFDYSAWFSDSPACVQVQYREGDLDLPDYTVISTNQMAGVAGKLADYEDFEVALTGLSDTVLSDGESATFDLVVSDANNDYTAGGFDNIGISGSTGQVVTYPAPAAEPLSGSYLISVNGQPVDVYTARVLDPPFDSSGRDYGGPYSFSGFDMEGPVEVTITAAQPINNTVIRPLSNPISFCQEDAYTLTLTLVEPCKLSVEPNGKNDLLLLFANPLEEDQPDPADPQVIYYGPGIHNAGKINVTDNQTLYLAGGAVVKGGVSMVGSNLRIAGRGILDSSDYAWKTGPTSHVIDMTGSHIEISGITIRGASRWTIVPNRSHDVTVRNVKICGARVQNDDGIDICNSRDILITDCFIRTDDDCIALKGMDWGPQPWQDVENIQVENSILWCDRARAFLLGHESRVSNMRNITLCNLDIPHFGLPPFLLEPGEDMMLQNIAVEDVRIHGEGQDELIRLQPIVNQYMATPVPGHIQNVSFKNISVFGNAGNYYVQLFGSNSTYQVENVIFDQVDIRGSILDSGSSELQLGSFTENILFK